MATYGLQIEITTEEDKEHYGVFSKVIKSNHIPRVGETIWIDGGDNEGACVTVNSVHYREDVKDRYGNCIVIVYGTEALICGTVDPVSRPSEETLKDMGWHNEEVFGPVTDQLSSM